MAKKLSVTIGIPAHNEEANIELLLKALVNQSQQSFRLEKIYVLCDGCTDQTAKTAGKFSAKYPFIRVLDDGRRIGRHGRTRQLYRASRSDVTIVFDADVLPADNHVAENLVQPFLDPAVVIVSGDRRPVPGHTFVEDLINVWDQTWAKATADLKGGHNVYHTFACDMAVRTKFIKPVKIPATIVSEARFLYFQALSQGKKFRFVTQAVVYYRSPATVGEYIRRLKRAGNQRQILKSFFGPLVDREYIPIPRYRKLSSFVNMFLRRPLHLIVTIPFHWFLYRLPKWDTEFQKKGYWTSLPSTKKLVLQ